MSKKKLIKAKHTAERAYALTRYRRAASIVLPEHFKEDRCINATRVAIEALGAFKIKVKPIVTMVSLYNEVFWDKVVENNGFPSDEQMPEWVTAGSWSVGVGEPSAGYDAKRGWPFHLVGVAGEWLVDSALSQFNRPQHSIHTDEMLVAPITKDFLEGGEPLVLENKHKNKIIYRRVPGVPFKHIAGFQRHVGNLGVAQKIVEVMRKDK